jgi:GR25 family glycosyltransferase involved in LPS biosynthesis
MATALVNIINPGLEYTLLANFQPPDKKLTYYPGVDYEGFDVYKSNNNAAEMEEEAIINNNIMGYNSLGYFKHTIVLECLKSNQYINKENGEGIYVKNTIQLDDKNFFNMFYKKLENYNVYMDGFFQFGYNYLKYKTYILNYIETHKHTHFIQTDRNEQFLMRDLIDDLPIEKQYDIAIHIRLNDFNGLPDFIEVEHYLNLFDSMVGAFDGKKICLVYQPVVSFNDYQYIATCAEWFKSRTIPLAFESNSLLVDFNIMKQAKILVCSMSTLSWTAAYLSKHIQMCYMPNYNFYATERQSFFFHKPISNTILYNIKTTPKILSQIKPYILTLPEYAERLIKLDGLNVQLALIGLDAAITEGVNGKQIHISDTTEVDGFLKQITWKDTTYFYDARVRICGTPMTRGEFGCAWSHLNLLKQLVADTDPSINYYLVLEDDVELIKPIAELYHLLDHIPADADLCHLAKSDWYPFNRINQVNDYFCEVEKQRYFNRTTAYLVSKKGAQKILDYTKNSINIPIDDLFNRIYRLTDNFRFYVPTDYFFKEQDNVASSITDINRS